MLLTGLLLMACSWLALPAFLYTPVDGDGTAHSILVLLTSVIKEMAYRFAYRPI